MALDTKEFVNALIENAYTHLCVVPCSFAKDVINEAINNPNIEYIASASEAVAVSIAAGLKLAGNKPIVIVQSSGLTNMGSCLTSLLKPYEISFPILSSWRTYKEGDSEIQHKHLATELPSLIEAYGYKYLILNKDDLNTAINQVNICDKTPSILIIKKDSFSKVELDDKHKLDLSAYEKRSAYLKILNEKYKDTKTVFIGTTGNTSREMYSFMPNTNNFYMAGNMGGALSLGLGLALSNKKVIVCGGDAEFVMHQGGLSTTGRYAKDIALLYLLFDNEMNKSTGGQNSYQKHLDYIQLAKSCNFKVKNETIFTLQEFKDTIDEFEKNTNTKGLHFVHIKCALDEEVSRPPINKVKVNKID